jgi:hypothetical protein
MNHHYTARRREDLELPLFKFSAPLAKVYILSIFNNTISFLLDGDGALFFR